MKAERNQAHETMCLGIYAQFLHCRNAAFLAPGATRLEVFEERLLDGLACLWALGEKVTVLQAMSIDAGVSPTTVHRKLKSLRRQGFISLEESESDNRIKFVTATPKALRHLAQLGDCVRTAADLIDSPPPCPPAPAGKAGQNKRRATRRSSG